MLTGVTLAGDVGCRVDGRAAHSALCEIIVAAAAWGDGCASLRFLTSHNVYGRAQVGRE